MPFDGLVGEWTMGGKLNFADDANPSAVPTLNGHKVHLTGDLRVTNAASILATARVAPAGARPASLP